MADEKIRLSIPDLSLVVLIGVSSSGKSTLCPRALPFDRSAVRGLFSRHGRRRRKQPRGHRRCVCFSALYRRPPLGAGPVDRGRMRPMSSPRARKPLVELAKRYHAQPVAIVFDLPRSLCEERAGCADRPRLAPPRNPPGNTASYAAASRASSAKVFAALLCCARPRMWRESKWCGRSYGPTAARSAVRSTSSEMSTGVAPNSKPCSTS